MQQNRSFFILIVGIVFFLSLDINLSMASEKKFETFDPERVKTWSFFSDGVMGGVSSGKAMLRNSGQDNFVRIEGNVSTENNGGFIQIRHNLKKPLEETIKGIRLKVRGNGENYYIFSVHVNIYIHIYVFIYTSHVHDPINNLMYAIHSYNTYHRFSDCWGSLLLEVMLMFFRQVTFILSSPTKQIPQCDIN